VAGFLIVILLLAAFWVVGVMPRRRRMQSHQSMQDSLDVGDEVITAGGLHGRVESLEDGEVRLEIAEGVVVTVDRRAIAAVATEVEVEVDVEADEPEDGEDEVDEAPEEEPPEEGENQPERVNESPRKPS
jgi:preprotein translocase subunit YajC